MVEALKLGVVASMLAINCARTAWPLYIVAVVCIGDNSVVVCRVLSGGPVFDAARVRAYCTAKLMKAKASLLSMMNSANMMLI
ncbi:hypothetical protein BKA62DRAFT_710833 [Auriculariales sp. MPI-PUGE-AT-0066]|nr:hypothetical protein BKA62DRAFT_710833 [Auriculariales sp. MPI-PUGE-AT-0066]